MYNKLADLREEATGLQVKLFNTKEIEHYIVYEIIPISNNVITL